MCALVQCMGAGVVLSGTIQGSLKERVQINPGSCSVGVKREKTMKWSKTGWFYLNLSSKKRFVVLLHCALMNMPFPVQYNTFRITSIKILIAI